MATEVLVGQVWTRRDPSGAVTRFTVQRIGRDQWGNRFVIGAVTSTKRIRCQVAEMLSGSGRYVMIGEVAA